jgi:dynein heavy chain
MYTRFLYNMVPLGWEKAAYPSLKPLASWVDDLILRLQRQDSWLRQGTPSAFWVSGFFFPQGFMTAVLQVHSRKNRIAIDTLKFRTSVQDIAPGEDNFNIPQAPEIGMLLLNTNFYLNLVGNVSCIFLCQVFIFTVCSCKVGRGHDHLV